jgi:chromosome segregation ATPase
MKEQVTQAEEKYEVAKKEAQRHKEDAKHTRRRLAGYDHQIKKVQQERDESQSNILTMKVAQQKQANENGWVGETLHKLVLVEASTTGKAWQVKHELSTEKLNLAREHSELQKKWKELQEVLEGQQKSSLPDAAIARYEKELEGAREEVDETRKLQALREENLRDVIYQYKKLESKYDAVVSRVKDRMWSDGIESERQDVVTPNEVLGGVNALAIVAV